MAFIQPSLFLRRRKTNSMDILHLVSKYAICYGVFFLVSYISKTESSNRLLNANGMVKNPGMLLGLQIAGILWFGVVPFFIFPYSFNDIVFGREMPSIFQLSCLVLIIIISIVIAIRESVKQHPGKIKNQQEAIFFNKKFIRRYFFLRAIFLICYEIFFRGYLLFDITPRTGIFFSVALNIGLYCLLHIFNDKKELIACIRFGFIL